MRPVAVIPARWSSSRFPGKPLALLGGRPIVQHVWGRCRRSGAFARVFIATDDPRIAEAARSFGADVAMTSPDCPSGTDRVAEVARAFPHVTVLVNVQGDEPLVPPSALGDLAACFEDDSVQMATLVRPLGDHERANPNVVKAVVAASGDALYFSRADVPFARDPDDDAPPRYAHIGLYAYRRQTLLRLSALPPALPARTRGEAGAAARVGARHPHPLPHHRLRVAGRGHPGGPAPGRGGARPGALSPPPPWPRSPRPRHPQRSAGGAHAAGRRLEAFGPGGRVVSRPAGATRRRATTRAGRRRLPAR